MLKLFIVFGGISILMSGIFLGPWIDGQSQSGNIHSTTVEHRNFRTKLGLVFCFVGLISFGIAGLIYVL